MERQVFGKIQGTIKYATETVLRFGLAGLLATAGCKPPSQFDFQPAPPGGTAFVRLNEVHINGRLAVISINCGTDPSTQSPREQIQDLYDNVVRGGANPNSAYPLGLQALKYSEILHSICLKQ